MNDELLDIEGLFPELKKPKTEKIIEKLNKHARWFFGRSKQQLSDVLQEIQDMVLKKKVDVTSVRHGQSEQNRWMRVKLNLLPFMNPGLEDRNTPLSPAGEKQAEAFFENEIVEHPELLTMPSSILCSGLYRSRQTSEVFRVQLNQERRRRNPYHKEIKAHREFEGINEIRLGLTDPFWWRRHPVLRAIYERYSERRRNNPKSLIDKPPVIEDELTEREKEVIQNLYGINELTQKEKIGETLQQVEERVLVYLQEIKPFLKRGNHVYIFAHGTVMAILHLLTDGTGRRLEDLSNEELIALLNPQKSMALLNCAKREYEYDPKTNQYTFKRHVINKESALILDLVQNEDPLKVDSPEEERKLQALNIRALEAYARSVGVDYDEAAYTFPYGLIKRLSRENMFSAIWVLRKLYYMSWEEIPEFVGIPQEEIELRYAEKVDTSSLPPFFSKFVKNN